MSINAKNSINNEIKQKYITVTNRIQELNKERIKHNKNIINHFIQKNRIQKVYDYEKMIKIYNIPGIEVEIKIFPGFLEHVIKILYSFSSKIKEMRNDTNFMIFLKKNAHLNEEFIKINAKITKFWVEDNAFAYFADMPLNDKYDLHVIRHTLYSVNENYKSNNSIIEDVLITKNILEFALGEEDEYDEYEEEDEYDEEAEYDEDDNFDTLVTKFNKLPIVKEDKKTSYDTILQLFNVYINYRKKSQQKYTKRVNKISNKRISRTNKLFRNVLIKQNAKVSGKTNKDDLKLEEVDGGRSSKSKTKKIYRK